MFDGWLVLARPVPAPGGAGTALRLEVLGQDLLEEPRLAPKVDRVSGRLHLPRVARATLAADLVPAPGARETFALGADAAGRPLVLEVEVRAR